MIQIDDAGSGSLIGGTCIGAMRTETHDFVYDIIPLKYFSEGIFKTKEYLTKCDDIVFDLLDRLSVNKDEQIEICQGYMFDSTRKKLSNKNYLFESVKIEDPLQTKIESTFRKYLLELGLPEEYLKYTKYPLHFHRLLKWVYADHKKREKICKRGWKSWKRHGNLDVSISYSECPKDIKLCLRCGKPITKGEPVKILKYRSNSNNTVILHKSC